MKPKIMLGCTTYDGKSYVLEKFIDRVKSLTYPDLEVIFIDNSETDEYMNKIKSFGMNCIKSKWDERSKIRLTNAQNIMRTKFLESDCTHLFVLEQDLIPPIDIIEKLLASDKDIVGGWYYITEIPRPCLCREWTLIDMKFFQKSPVLTDMSKEKLIKCFSGSFGVSLIKRKVIEEIKFKAYVGFVHHADTWFYFDCEKKGFEVFVDTDLLIPHFQNYKWGDIVDKDNKIDKDKMKLKLEGELE